MGDKSKIEWTDSTWNPVRGCSVVSEGCRNCYAMVVAARFSGPGMPYEGLAYRNSSRAHWTGKVRLIEEHLNDPLRWKTPRRIFVNSMSDLFHESLSDGAILRVFDVMRQCPQHTFQLLTKRPERMRNWFERWANTDGEPREPQLVRGPNEQRKAHPSPRGQMFAEYLETLGATPPPGCAWPTFDWMGGMRWWPASAFTLPNVWLGTSCEDQKTADERIPLLLQTPAAVRWISAEPLLGPVDLSKEYLTALLGKYPFQHYSGPRTTLAHLLNWVVVGGESGPGARPMHPDWARSLRDQCTAAGVPFFFKQWGQWGAIGGCDDPCGRCLMALHGGAFTNTQWIAGPHLRGASQMHPLSKKEAGRLLDGREWNEYPKAKTAAA